MPFRNGGDAKWVQHLWGHSFEILQYLTIPFDPETPLHWQNKKQPTNQTNKKPKQI